MEKLLTYRCDSGEGVVEEEEWGDHHGYVKRPMARSIVFLLEALPSSTISSTFV